MDRNKTVTANFTSTGTQSVVQEWDKSFGGTDSDELAVIEQTSDGGYILAGSSKSGAGGNKSSGNNGSYDAWIVRLDANGNKAWDRNYGDSGENVVYALAQAGDGGFVVGGRNLGFCRIDSSGNKLWETAFQGEIRAGIGELVCRSSPELLNCIISDRERLAQESIMPRVELKMDMGWDRDRARPTQLHPDPFPCSRFHRNQRRPKVPISSLIPKAAAISSLTARLNIQANRLRSAGRSSFLRCGLMFLVRTNHRSSPTPASRVPWNGHGQPFPPVPCRSPTRSAYRLEKPAKRQ